MSLCWVHNLWLLADEVYERLYYGRGGPVHSAPAAGTTQ